MILTELLAVVGLEFDKKGSADAEAGIERITGKLKTLGLALVSGAVATGIFDFVQGMATAASEISGLSARTDVGTAELQQLGVVAGTLGIELEDLAESIEDVGEKFSEAAAEAGGEAGKRFRELGIDVRGANGEVLTGADALNTYLDAVAALDNASDRTRALSDISDTMRRFGPLVADGRNEVRDLLGELAGLEGITGDVIEGSDELNAQQEILKFAWTSIKNVLVRELLPAFVEGTKIFIRLAKGFISLVKNTNVVRNVLIGLGVVAVAVAIATIGAWGPVVLTFLAVAAVIAFVVLAVDDLITFLEGGDSVIGRFLDSLFGIGTAQTVLQAIKETFQGLINAFRIGFQLVQTGAALAGLGLRVMKEAVVGVLDAVFGFGASSQFFDGFVQGVRNAGQSVLDFLLAPIRTVIGALRALGVATDIDDVIGDLSAVADRANNTQVPAGLARRTGTPSAATASPAAARRAGGGATTITQQTDVNITASGADQAQVRRIQQVVDRQLARRNSEAAEALTEAAGS